MKAGVVGKACGAGTREEQDDAQEGSAFQGWGIRLDSLVSKGPREMVQARGASWGHARQGGLGAI